MYAKLTTYYYLLMTIMILIYNSLFYTFTLPVVKLIGYHTKTDENILTSQAIIGCLTTDMIILPIMIGMNLVEYHDNTNTGVLSFFNSGKHTDFGAEWYPDVGYQMVLTMIIYSFQPYIDMVVEFALMHLFRFYYKKFWF